MFRGSCALGILMMMCFSAFAMEKKEKKSIPKLNFQLHLKDLSQVLSPRPLLSPYSPSKKTNELNRIKALLSSAKWGDLRKVIQGLYEASQKGLNVVKILNDDASFFENIENRYPLLAAFIRVHKELFEKSNFSELLVSRPLPQLINENIPSEGLKFWLLEIYNQCLTVNYNLIFIFKDDVDIIDNIFTFELLSKIISEPLDKKLENTLLSYLRKQIKSQFTLWEKMWPYVKKSMLLNIVSLDEANTLGLLKNPHDSLIELEDAALYEDLDGTLFRAISTVDFAKINTFINEKNIQLERSLIKNNFTPTEYVRRQERHIYAFVLQSNLIWSLMDQARLYPLLQREYFEVSAAYSISPR